MPRPQRRRGRSGRARRRSACASPGRAPRRRARWSPPPCPARVGAARADVDGTPPCGSGEALGDPAARGAGLVVRQRMGQLRRPVDERSPTPSPLHDETWAGVAPLCLLDRELQVPAAWPTGRARPARQPEPPPPACGGPGGPCGRMADGPTTPAGPGWSGGARLVLRHHAPSAARVLPWLVAPETLDRTPARPPSRLTRRRRRGRGRAAPRRWRARGPRPGRRTA